MHPFHGRRLGDCCHEGICQHNTGSQTIMCVREDTMEHIHGGILCLLCKWISPPRSQAKGQKESPLGFIIAVYWNTLKHLYHRRKGKKKEGWILFLFFTKKVKSRQILASKRSPFFKPFLGFFLLFFFVCVSHQESLSLFLH